MTTVEGTTATVNTTWVGLSATCPPGTTVIGGGWNSPSTANVYYEVRANYPTSDTTWTINMRNSAGGNVSVTAYARCLALN